MNSSSTTSHIEQDQVLPEYQEYRVFCTKSKSGRGAHYAIGRAEFLPSRQLRPIQCSPEGKGIDQFTANLALYRKALLLPWILLKTDRWSEYKPRLKTFPRTAPAEDDNYPYAYEYRIGVDKSGMMSVFQCFYLISVGHDAERYSEIHGVCASGESERDLCYDLIRYSGCIHKPPINISYVRRE
jgi:hypothetical protein